MIVTIIKKCPCKYVFMEQKKIKVRSITSQKFIAIVPGRGPKSFKSPDTKEDLLSTTCLEGNKDFKDLKFPNSNNSFIICPKCGTVLDSEIAVSITRTKEDDDKC